LTSHPSCVNRRRDWIPATYDDSAVRSLVTWDGVLEQEFIVANKKGLHARAAAQIVRLATQFEADVWITKDGVRVNGKSILDVLTLATPHGSKVLVATEGRDADAVMQALAGLFQTKFGEE
jgi:phosphocarrier protein HPr